MGTDADQTLTDAIRDMAALLWQDRTALEEPSPELKRRITELIRGVNDKARAAARSNGYLHSVDVNDPPDPDLETWGRRLHNRTLHSLGVAGLLADLPEPVIPDEVVSELAGYLAGAPVPGERMYVIDAAMPISGRHEIAGWVLTRIRRGDLDALTPLPSARRFAEDPWDDALGIGGCVVLRQVDPRLEPRANTWFPAELGTDLTESEVSIAAWAPLLLINLTAYDRVIVGAEYEIEPGRVVDRIRGTGLGLVDNGDGEVMWEEPAWGPYRPSPDEFEAMLSAVAILEPHLGAFQAWTGLTVKQGRKKLEAIEGRLRRSAHRLLAVSALLGVNGDVTRPRDRPEVIFWLVSVLEHLLVPDASEGDYARRVAQRAAILIGDDGPDRLAIYRDVKAAYGIRSTVVHGSPLGEKQTEDLGDLPRRLYGYTREVFRALVVLGPQFQTGELCDEALLSQEISRQIADPLHAVLAALPEQTRSLRAATYRARMRGNRRRRV